MKKLIFVLFIFGFIQYGFAATIGTGLEWEAHDVRAVVYDAKKDAVLELTHDFYDTEMFEAKFESKGADSDLLHEGDFVKVVFDNLWDRFGGKHGCTEIVSIGVGALSEENLICRSRALALLYDTMKNASSHGAAHIELKDKIKKSHRADYNFSKCVEAGKIVELYNSAIQKDSYLKEQHTAYPKRRWEYWDIMISADWKNRIGKKDDDGVTLYICGEGGMPEDSVVYHMNFGIPVDQLYDNDVFYQLVQGAGDRERSQEEWANARTRAETCRKCVEQKYGEMIQNSPSDVFWSSFRGLLTYMYYGWFHDEDYIKKSKGKDSHAVLLKSSLDTVIEGLRNKFTDVDYEKIHIIGGNQNYKCYSECISFPENVTKTGRMDTKWTCNLFYKETVAIYPNAEQLCKGQKVEGEIWRWPWNGSATGKALPAYWTRIDKGAYQNVEWEERDALVVVAESRTGHGTGKTIRKMYEPTTNPDAAEMNVKNGYATMLKLQFGARDKK